MARPIAYNASGPLSGSIRGGSVNYTIDGAGRDYTTFAGKKWVPSADGAAPIVFVTDSFTRGLTTAGNAYPLFFSCAGTSSAAILYTANRLPGSPGNFTDTGSAFNDLTATYGYFILEGNDPFEGIDADGLALDVDASKISSYPQTGTSWRDLSGNGNTGALTNGPTFNLNGWFDFDGTDDWVQLSSLALSTTAYTKIAWFNPDGATNNIISGGGDGQHAFWMAGTATNLQAGHNGAWTTVNYSPGTMTGRWWFGAVTFNTSTGWVLYINGSVVDTDASTTTFTGGNAVRIAAYDNASNLFDGKISTAQVYNRVLTTAEIKQNYFGAPIVTDGLVFAVDADNIVSYPKSGTSVYNLTGSNVATLVNGLTYQLGNGGYFLSDGTDDGLTTPDASNLDLNNFTLEGWVWWNEHKNFGSLFVKGPGGSGNLFNYCFFFYSYAVVCGFGDGGAFYNVSISTPTTNTWHHIVGTYDGATLKFYLDGVLAASAGIVATPNQNSNELNIIQPDYPINGRVASGRVYNRALTAAEVQQNYQAEQYRFEGPASIVTNGLVLNFDASNKDSYPGTGTTWYTLVGSDNGTLINGTSFSTDAGGSMVFDGIDDYVSFGNPLDQSQLSQVWTVQAWINITTKPSQILVEGLNNNLWIEYGANNSLLYLNGGVNDYYTYGGQFTAQGWVLATFRFNNANGNRQIWRNLSNISTTGPNNTSTPVGQNSTFKIGNNNSNTILGKIGNLLVYNKYLTDAEITQNYNAQKSRFGL